MSDLFCHELEKGNDDDELLGKYRLALKVLIVLYEPLSEGKIEEIARTRNIDKEIVKREIEAPEHQLKANKEKRRRERSGQRIDCPALRDRKAQRDIALDHRKFSVILGDIVREKRIPHQIKEREKYLEDFSQYTGIAIRVEAKVEPMRKLLFPMEIYGESYQLVYGGGDMIA